MRSIMSRMQIGLGENFNPRVHYVWEHRRFSDETSRFPIDIDEILWIRSYTFIYKYDLHDRRVAQKVLLDPLAFRRNANCRRRRH